MNRFATHTLAILLFVSLSAVAADFTTTKTPVSTAGVRATADLPAERHHRNVGGSDGAGLCVYTSSWHLGEWQNVPEFGGLREWMQVQPGGSYPEKFDRTLANYCRLKGVPVPGYIQHTGGDVEFLEAALKTGRMVAVTYCGVDGPGRYGNEVIAHMVNLVHLDATAAAILDNNFPGTWLWMSRAAFIARWKGVDERGRVFYAREGLRSFPVGGGWAIALLASPPPPYPEPPTSEDRDAPYLPFGQCSNGTCPLAVTPLGEDLGPVPPVGSKPPSDRHEWGWIKEIGMHGWRYKDDTPAPPALVKLPGRGEAIFSDDAPPPKPSNFLGGVDAEKLAHESQWWHTGRKVTRAEAVAALAGDGLSDDSNRWHLVAVGDGDFLARVKADVATLPSDVRVKLHMNAFAPDAWQAAQFRLPAGVTLRKPAVARIGADLGTIPPAEYSSVRLADLLGVAEGPAPKPLPAPMPKPKPDPEPTPTDACKCGPSCPCKPKLEPTPTPEPKPSPQPEPPPANSGAVWLAAFLAALILLFRKR